MASPANVTIGFRLGDSGNLIVNYQVPPGLNRLQLPGNQAPLRQKQWRIVKGTATLDDQGIELNAHTNPAKITLSAKTATAAPDRVYPLVVPFSDGSVVINTAAFVPANACKRTVLRFEPQQGNHAVLRGKVYTKSVTVKAFCSDDHDGSWAYLGTAPMEQHKTFLMITDPGAPSWIVRGTRAALQKALTNYGSRLNLRLPVFPTVYLSFSANNAQAHPWYHGDVLAFDTVRLSYVGKSWQKTSSTASNLLSTQLFIAHEAFHFWNGDIKLVPTGAYISWLHEGGAQLAALFTSKQAGWISSADFLRRLNGNLQRCLLETGDQTWAEIKGQAISGRIYYDCGVTFNFLTAALDNLEHPEQGFFGLWSKLLRVDRPAYSIADFLRITAQNAHDAAAWKDLKQALAGTAGSLSSPIQSLFTALEIPAHPVGDSTQPDIPASTVLNPFLMPLLRTACNSPHRYGFWTRKGYIKVDVPTHCKTFSRTKLLVAVGGYKLTEAPLAAWHKAYSECRGKGTVTFTVLHGNPLPVPCKKSVPKPPRLLQLEAYRPASIAHRESER